MRLASRSPLLAAPCGSHRGRRTEELVFTGLSEDARDPSRMDIQTRATHVEQRLADGRLPKRKSVELWAGPGPESRVTAAANPSRSMRLSTSTPLREVASWLPCRLLAALGARDHGRRH